jgi:hypothetical protein
MSGVNNNADPWFMAMFGQWRTQPTDVSGIGRGHAATATTTQTSVIANMATTGHRTGPRDRCAGGQGTLRPWPWGESK